MIRNSSFLDLVILKQLFENREYFVKVMPHVKEKYWKDIEESQGIIRAIVEYVKRYKTIPTYDGVKLLIFEDPKISDHQAVADFLKEEVHDKVYDFDNTRLLFDQTEAHFQLKELYEVMLKAGDIMNNPSKIAERVGLLPAFRDALSVALDRDNGTEYLSDPAIKDQYEYYHTPESRLAIPEWPIYNQATNGGPYRKSLNMIVGLSGVGKTTFLCNVARQYIKDGKNVLYITMEVPKNGLMERQDGATLGISTKLLQHYLEDDYVAAMKKVRESTKGRLMIKEYPSASISSTTLQLLLDAVKNSDAFNTDILIVDYAGLMVPDRFKQADNMYVYKGAIAQELRGLAHRNDLVLWSGSQANRSGYNKPGDYEIDVIAESAVWIHESDWVGALLETPELRAQGRQEIKQLKSRYCDMFQIRRWLVETDKDSQTITEVPRDSAVPVAHGAVELSPKDVRIDPEVKRDVMRQEREYQKTKISVADLDRINEKEEEEISNKALEYWKSGTQEKL